MNGGAFPSSPQTIVSGRILSLCFGRAGPPWNYAVSSRTRTVGWLTRHGFQQSSSGNPQHAHLDLGGGLQPQLSV